ncbi:MAG TPA: DNA-formamidopyrimidine glycosylase family protein [Candidatus Solibacter sp.]|jgi:formamidopyrimidine-DNA glycosylase|nr:DNA-formamidopyrimidine glycosylase family protein [Candidatus Solibacter sp.]
MPEMPELEVLSEYLGPRLAGQEIRKVTVSPKFGFLLRTPPADLARALEGSRIERIWRRGKFLVLDVDSKMLVINPMLGGRLHWSGSGGKPPPATIMSMDLSGGETLRLTDFARMARVYLVDQGELDSVPGWAELGPEADSVTLEDFRARIRRHPGELKNLLRNQAFVAGVGNAYSDEILHEAQMLPLRKRSTLSPEDVDSLHEATTSVLADAVAKIRAQPDYEPHKQDRSFMKVHLRGGEACPRCGHRIAEIKARGEVFNYCRGCQK